MRFDVAVEPLLVRLREVGYLASTEQSLEWLEKLKAALNSTPWQRRCREVAACSRRIPMAAAERSAHVVSRSVQAGAVGTVLR